VVSLDSYENRSWGGRLGPLDFDLGLKYGSVGRRGRTPSAPAPRPVKPKRRCCAALPTGERCETILNSVNPSMTCHACRIRRLLGEG